MRKLALALAAVAACAAAAPAEASIVVTAYTFSGPSAGSGSFSLACNDVDPKDPCTLAAFSYGLGGSTFDLSNTGIEAVAGLGLPPEILSYNIGGTFNGVGIVDDFGLSQLVTDFVIGFDLDTPTSAVITYHIGPNATGITGDALTVTAAGAVPEPATWALMLLGFGAIGIAMRRRSRQKKVAALA